MTRPVPGPWLPPPIGPRYVAESGPAEVEWRAQCDRCGDRRDVDQEQGRRQAHLHVHLPARGECGVSLVMVCYAKCYPCQFGEHRNPPEWHTWADQDDVDHAAVTGQDDPSKSRCGCPCAVSA